MNFSVQEIKKPDIVSKLQDIADHNGGVMANRALAVVRKMFNWAMRNGYADYNPCHMVDRPVPETSRERFYSDDELAALWRAFEQVGIQGKAYKVAALTGQMTPWPNDCSSLRPNVSEKLRLAHRIEGAGLECVRETFVYLCDCGDGCVRG